MTAYSNFAIYVWFKSMMAVTIIMILYAVYSGQIDFEKSVFEGFGISVFFIVMCFFISIPFLFFMIFIVSCIGHKRRTVPQQKLLICFSYIGMLMMTICIIKFFSSPSIEQKPELMDQIISWVSVGSVLIIVPCTFVYLTQLNGAKG